jgi:beta-mannosidase
MNKSVDFEMEIYQSSLVQAYGVGVAIQAHRIKRPECWGTLYWQYNDAWPGISWASMDYYGRWKALQYSAKRLYMDVAVMFKGNTEVAATIVNDKLYDVECLLTLKVLTT